jgi:hypothetical protein
VIGWLLEHAPAIAAGALGSWTWHWWRARRTTWLIHLGSVPGGGRLVRPESHPTRRQVPAYVDAIVDALASYAARNPDVPDVTVRVERTR